MKRLYCLIIIIFVGHPANAQLFINEFMASNDKTIADEFNEYDDWIEIYNGNDYSVDLSSFYLTDDLDNPMKWSFPAISITAKGFLLIWVDGDTGQGILHTNFKLSADGEQLGLYDGANFMDSLSFGPQKTDISYGRYPDGGVTWYSFINPTPNAPNNDSFIEYAESPAFSPQGGFYSGPVNVELSVTSSNATIRYTLNSYEPTETSSSYTAPIVINKTTVVRARAYESGYHPSKISTCTYIFNKDFDIATLSLVTNPPGLWDADSGIYVNYDEGGDQWERYASVEFYEANNDFGFSENAGIRIHGGGPRRFPKKSFRLYFRSEYGKSWLNYSLFEAKNQINEFKRLIVHSGSVDMPASDWPYGWTLLRDPLMHELCRRIDGIYAAHRPVAVFLNAEPWGIYNIFERPDQYYTESNYGEQDVDIIEDGWYARIGDITAWTDMIDFFENNDLSSDANYETAKTFIDIDNYTDYCILEIYGGNRDWPHNNYIAFKPRKQDSIWRWILWDMDACFIFYGLYFNMLEWAISDTVENTLILKSLLKNENYKNKFINRYADLMNTILSPAYCINLIDSLASVIRNDIDYETDKWGSSPESWEEEGIKGRLYYFSNRRYGIARDDIEEVFSLGGNLILTIDSAQNGHGKVKVNSIYISNYPWEGVYFKKIPISLTAIPDPGYHFVGWSDPSVLQVDEISITLYNDYTIYAIFEADTSVGSVVINEINYNSADYFNPEDWIELYNLSPETLDVGNWHLKDNDDLHDFVFPSNTTIDPVSFLILCRDTTSFHSLFPFVTNYIGNFDFGFGGGGDQVRIFNASLMLIDSVEYDDTAPWPTEPDGNGPTLELIDPELDNALPESWQASKNHGTPGQPNSILLSISGDITYHSSSIAIPQALMSLTGPITKNTATDTNGFFCLTGLVDGDYKLTPAKENDIGSSISALDAAWILQYSVALRTFSPYQMIASDVTGNGKVTNYDAAYILRYSVGLINKFPIMTDSTHFWKFVPDDFRLDSTNWAIAPDSIFYTPLKSDTIGNYKGLIYGDVTGNWSPGGGNLARFIAAEPKIRLENFYAKPGNKILLPLYIDRGSGIVAISFVLKYDPRLLNSVGASLTPLTRDYLIATNIEQDQIRVALAGSQPIDGSGALVNLEFEILKTELPDANSRLQITEMVINDVQTRANIQRVEFLVGSSLPTEYALHQNYPNPFNSETLIKYQVPKPGKVVLKIYNPLGQEIRSLVNRENVAGYHEVLWDGKNNQAQPAPSGLYFYRIQAAEFQAVNKLLLIK